MMITVWFSFSTTFRYRQAFSAPPPPSALLHCNSIVKTPPRPGCNVITLSADPLRITNMTTSSLSFTDVTNLDTNLNMTTPMAPPLVEPLTTTTTMKTASSRIDGFEAESEPPLDKDVSNAGSSCPSQLMRQKANVIHLNQCTCGITITDAQIQEGVNVMWCGVQGCETVWVHHSFHLTMLR